MRLKLVSLLSLVGLSLHHFVDAQVVYGDRWNYEGTITRDDGFKDYGPAEWGNIECDESSREGLDACLGYTDKWDAGQGWEIKGNYCFNCPAGQNGTCGRHHNSPINLERNRGLGYWNKTEENNGNPGANADPMANECIDQHWMKYEDSSCPIDQLIAADSFTIERHALRVSQPITVTADDVAEINCSIEGLDSRFGHIDFSKGFSQWWYLSHIDIHTPSEHTQEGTRYDGELQLHHVYSVNASVAGVDNELATVSMFLQAYDDVPPYRDLDRVICQWRRKEYEVRTACGLDPVTTSYPGCFPLSQRDRNLRTSTDTSAKKTTTTFQTAQDLILAHDHQRREIASGRSVSTGTLPTLRVGPENSGPAERSDEEWAEFISKHSARFQEDDELWKELHAEFNGDHEKAHDEFHKRGRHLIEGNELTWFNYWPMLGVRTEYYFRYGGTQTIPPCYGNFTDESRAGTVNWRVMKDPIRIHRRQLTELQRLIKERIAPPEDPVMACRPDTAAGSTKAPVDTARPLQSEHLAHFMVFCECKDWPSKWPEDREWCAIGDIYERFYSKPYNFESSGF